MSDFETKVLNRLISIETKIDAIPKGKTPFKPHVPKVKIEKAPTYEQELNRIYKLVDEDVKAKGGIYCPKVKRHVLERCSDVNKYGNSCFWNIGRNCNPNRTIADFDPADCDVRKEASKE